MAIRNRIKDFPGPLIPPSGATSYGDLLDAATADLPAVNTPLAEALELKADADHAHAAASITYSPTASGLTATDVQAAIDELADEIPAWSEINDKPSTFAPIIGSGAGDAVAGNDSRLTNARTPTAHTHPLAELTGVTPAAIGAEPAGRAVAMAIILA